MTCIDAETSTVRTGAAGSPAERRKSVLFCPVCGHESAPDGDWYVTTTDGATEYVCPRCERVVATR